MTELLAAGPLARQPRLRPAWALLAAAALSACLAALLSSGRATEAPVDDATLARLRATVRQVAAANGEPRPSAWAVYRPPIAGRRQDAYVVDVRGVFVCGFCVESVFRARNGAESVTGLRQLTITLDRTLQTRGVVFATNPVDVSRIGKPFQLLP